MKCFQCSARYNARWGDIFLSIYKAARCCANLVHSQTAVSLCRKVWFHDGVIECPIYIQDIVPICSSYSDLSTTILPDPPPQHCTAWASLFELLSSSLRTLLQWAGITTWVWLFQLFTLLNCHSAKEAKCTSVLYTICCPIFFSPHKFIVQLCRQFYYLQLKFVG